MKAKETKNIDKAQDYLQYLRSLRNTEIPFHEDLILFLEGIVLGLFGSAIAYNVIEVISKLQ